MVTKTELQALVDGTIPESLTLDYKRSDALGLDSQRRNELAKDVSAFANSAGGRIVYGIPEHNQVPQPLDGGVDKTVIKPEWIEQVLRTNIQPPVEGLRISQVDAEQGNNQVFYVIDIPPATARAPHQATDKKYYRRYNFQSVPMDDFEVKDVFRRSSTPALRLELALEDGRKSVTVVQPPNPERKEGRPLSDPIVLGATLINDATQPAEYVVIDVYLHPQLELSSYSPSELTIVRLDHPQPRVMQQLRWRFSTPTDMPVFRELPRPMPGTVLFRVDVITASQSTPTPYPIGFRLRCPGVDVERWGTLVAGDGSMKLELDQ